MQLHGSRPERARHVRVLIEKAERLTRFFHSRHVVRLRDELDSGIVLEHHSEDIEPPQPAENLANCGIHLSLLEQLGCRGLRLRFPRSREAERWVYDSGTYQAPPAGDGYHVWEFHWQKFSPTRRPMPGLDELLLAQERRPELTEEPESVLAVQDVVRSDLGRTWTVLDVASRLQTSQRSLQRSLAAEGTRFSEVLDRIRLQEARRLLGDSKLTITEIGYLCGFADTAHFSRRFKSRFGHPPSKLRAS